MLFMIETLNRYLFDSNNVIILKTDDHNKFLREVEQKQIIYKAKIIKLSDLIIKPHPQYYLFMKKHHHIYPELAIQFLPYFDYLPSRITSQDNKLNQLNEIADSLIKNKILNEYPSQLFVNKSIFVYQVAKKIPYLSKKQLIYTNISELDSKSAILNVIQSNTYQRSIFLLILKILDLIEKGINIDKIKVLNASSDDIFQLSKYLSDIGIPYNSHLPTPLMAHPQVIDFVENIEKNGLLNAIDIYKDLYKDSFSLKIFDKLMEIINHYPIDEINEYRDLMLFEIENTSIRSQPMNPAISIFSDQSISFEHDVFYLILHFIDGRYPLKSIDNDYLNDSLKKIIGIETSYEINKQDIDEVESFLKSSEKIFAFYYKENGALSYTLPDLQLQYNLVDESVNENLLSYFRYMPHYHHKNIKSQLDIYNPAFTGVSKRTTDLLISSNVNLSQTSIKTFLECRFHYLLKHLLKLEKFDTTYYLFYGNIVHHLLELTSKNQEFNYESVFEKFKKDFPVGELYKYGLFTKILEERLNRILTILPNVTFHDEISPFLAEEQISFTATKDNRFKIIGKIDQIYMYRHETVKHIIIVDYKTGDTSYKYEDTIALKQIQLLMYYYLFLNKYNPDEFEINGLYYQQVHLKRQTKEEVTKGSQKSFAYDGISILDDMVSKTIANNAAIIGLKPNDSGFKENNRLFTKEQMVELQTKLSEQIDQIIQLIDQGEFSINPYSVNPGKTISESCEYCPFKNICFNANRTATPFDEAEGVEDNENELF